MNLLLRKDLRRQDHPETVFHNRYVRYINKNSASRKHTIFLYRICRAKILEILAHTWYILYIHMYDHLLSKEDTYEICSDLEIRPCFHRPSQNDQVWNTADNWEWTGQKSEIFELIWLKIRQIVAYTCNRCQWVIFITISFVVKPQDPHQLLVSIARENCGGQSWTH